MSRTQLAGLIIAVAASSALPATAAAGPTPHRAGFSIDVGTSEAVVAPTARPNGIIAILIGQVVAPPRPTAFSGDAYDNEMG